MHVAIENWMKKLYLFRSLKTKDADYLWTTNWIGILHNQQLLFLGRNRRKPLAQTNGSSEPSWFWRLYTEFLIRRIPSVDCDDSNARHFNQCMCDLYNLQSPISSFPVIMNMNQNENLYLKSQPIVTLDLSILLYLLQPARLHVPENGPVQRKYCV